MSVSVCRPVLVQNRCQREQVRVWIVSVCAPGEVVARVVGGGRPSDMVKGVPNNGSLQAKAPPHCDGWARCHPQPAREHGHGSQRRPRPLSPHHRICPVDVEEDIKMYGSRDLGAGLLAGTTNVVVDFCKEREREVFRPTRAARLFNAVLPASEAGRVPGPPHPCPPAHSI